MRALLRRLSRFFKFRILLFLTILVIFLYAMRILQSSKDSYKSLEIHLVTLASTGGYFIPRSLKKIDWHDYNLIEYEKHRTGLGEQGKPAHLPKEDAFLEDKLYAENGFNGALSDKIALNRSTPDIRHPLCKKLKHIESLPMVSVVVPFHNEHWSTLLRTAISVINQSPTQLIKEIILVDDASTKDFLKSPLEDQVSHIPKVRVVRVAKRSGLITARLAGAKVATADVIIFLDSHTEATVNWLPPLLEPIALNYRCVTCPFIDVIAYDTFEYRPQDSGARGAFDWEFFYKRLPLLPRDLENMPQPFPSPVMAGGLFAISRVYFWELGGYDPGLDIWGGEQYELSFKIWQCGGRMVDVPCSRVGHIYRKFAPFPNPNHGDFVGKNYRRVAEVWMDEYAEHLYRRRPHYRQIDPGDISEQKALRKRLKCKSFHWFMTQIAFDLTAKYPVKDLEPFASGRIRPLTDPLLCVDAHHAAQNDKLHLNKCTESATGEQQFVLSPHKDIKSAIRNMCWDLPDAAPTRPVLLYACHLGGGNQLWRYRPKDLTIVQGLNYKCLDYDQESLNLFISDCEEDTETQKWTLDHINEDMMAKWDEVHQRVIEPQVTVLE